MERGLCWGFSVQCEYANHSREHLQLLEQNLSPPELFDFSRNLPQANKKICVGWSESANTDDKMYGFVRQIAIYDSILDAIVSDLRRLFFEQVPVGVMLT